MQALKILSETLPKDHPELDAVREDLATLFAQRHQHESVIAMLVPLRIHRCPGFPDPAATLRRLTKLAASLCEMHRWSALIEVISWAVKEASAIWKTFSGLGVTSLLMFAY